VKLEVKEEPNSPENLSSISDIGSPDDTNNPDYPCSSGEESYRSDNSDNAFRSQSYADQIADESTLDSPGSVKEEVKYEDELKEESFVPDNFSGMSRSQSYDDHPPSTGIPGSPRSLEEGANSPRSPRSSGLSGLSSGRLQGREDPEPPELLHQQSPAKPNPDFIEKSKRYKRKNEFDRKKSLQAWDNDARAVAWVNSISSTKLLDAVGKLATSNRSYTSAIGYVNRAFLMRLEQPRGRSANWRANKELEIRKQDVIAAQAKKFRDNSLTDLPVTEVEQVKFGVRCGSFGLLEEDISKRIVEIDWSTVLPPNQDGSIFTKRCDVTSDAAKRIYKLQQVRELELQNSATLRLDDLSSRNRKLLLEAIVCYTRGILPSEPCTNCTRGLGRFEHCVFLDGEFGGACCNCRINHKDSTCTFREKDSNTK
jgi:hypothetical protein